VTDQTLDQVAVVLDGSVLSASDIAAPITDGQALIFGTLTAPPATNSRPAARRLPDHRS
jgi:hypothetical protein